MAQHVRMDGERHLGGLAEPSNEMVKAHWADWPATFGNEDVGFRRVLATYLAQGADLIAPNRVNAWRATLCSADMQSASIKLYVVPLQITGLACSHPMSVSHQDHGCIAMAVAIVLGGFNQTLDLPLGEIAAANCEVFSCWRVGIGSLFCHERNHSGLYELEDNCFFVHSLELGI